jgi:hypothetical protein
MRLGQTRSLKGAMKMWVKTPFLATKPDSVFKLACDRYYTVVEWVPCEWANGRRQPRGSGGPGPVTNAIPGPASSVLGRRSQPSLVSRSRASRHAFDSGEWSPCTATIMDLRLSYPSRLSGCQYLAHARLPPLYTCLLTLTPRSLLLERMRP